jgi:hypothetical protein
MINAKKLHYLFCFFIIFKIYAQDTSIVLEKELNALKIFRTYYYLEIETLEMHQFEAWFHTKEDGWDNILIAANEDSQISEFSKDDYIVDHTIRAGWPSPNSKYTPVPSNLEKMSEGIVQSYKNNFPEKQFDRFEIHYLGYFSRVALHEIIPSGTRTINNWRTKKPERVAKTARFNFAVKSKTNTIEDLESGSMSGSGTLSLDFINQKAKIGQWMDFKLPAHMEGTSLLSLNFNKDILENISAKNLSTVQTLQELKSKLLLMVKKSTKSWLNIYQSNKKIKSPLAKIFKASEKTLFPTKSQQYFTFKIDVYGRSSDYGNQLNHEVKFFIPVNNKSFEIEKSIPNTNVSIKVKGNLANGDFQITTSNGLGVQKESNKKLDLKSYQIVLNKCGFGFIDGYLEFDRSQQGEVREDLSLPGNGIYRSFDIYPGRFQDLDITAPLSVSI